VPNQLLVRANNSQSLAPSRSPPLGPFLTYTLAFEAHRIRKDTPEPSLLKPHGESQISRYPDGKGPILLVVRVKRLRPSTLRQAIEMTHAVTDSSV
jgi:hypothetical protein